jgi:5,10-methylene-tetrahydrofolate dehydrogenase/methenyl tetrahydrofolate cyclohydrolase
MTKILNGSDLVAFIKERQAHQVRGLRQHDEIFPRLAIIQTIDNDVIDTYVRMKRAYGADILIDVDVYKIPQDSVRDKIAELNDDPAVHGMIIQLPLDNTDETDEIVKLVRSDKDVDGLGAQPDFDPATPTAILWLLAGYNVELKGQNVVVVGQGRLVGAPLIQMLRDSGVAVNAVDADTKDPAVIIKKADVIITATGVPNLIKPDMVKIGAVVVDAGTASEDGRIVGDVAPEIRERNDVTVTPEKGGVGPLTIAALFDNVIRAARATITRSNATLD